jgi:serpin B
MEKLYSPAAAAESINALGIDLLRTINKSESYILLSPYSIQCALAMAYAGAEGETKTEMARVLHYPPDDAEIHGSFAALRTRLAAICRQSAAAAERFNRRMKQGRDQERGRNAEWPEAFEIRGEADPTALSVANWLFLQTGFEVREPFVSLLKSDHGVLIESLDFGLDPAGKAHYINAWIEEQTRKRIQNLIPPGALDSLTRIVLANAIYLKAPWSKPFNKAATVEMPFRLQSGETIMVPTMTARLGVGFSKREGFVVLALPYDSGDLQFIILMPDSIQGLTELTKKLNPKLLEECSTLAGREVILHMPKFRIDPPVMQLGKDLQALGLKSPFDIPHGSANFEAIAPRRKDDYLAISEVFHKTFLDIDEEGTEATAATALGFVEMGISEMPAELFIDRPFFFAIQHRISGACLFMGKLVDPRDNGATRQ